MKLQDAMKISKVEFSLSPKSESGPDGWKVPGAIRPYYNETFLVTFEGFTYFNIITYKHERITFEDINYVPRPEDFELLALEDCWEPIH
jgi:hypothetical protein